VLRLGAIDFSGHVHACHRDRGNPRKDHLGRLGAASPSRI
jgi:hypothetical protein